MTTVATVGNLVTTRDLTNTWIKLILEYFNSVYLGLIAHSLVNLTFRGPCIVIYSYNKTNEMHYFTNLFWFRTPRVSDRFTVHHQESSTVHTAVGICHTG
jgi:hypothetical protein